MANYNETAMSYRVIALDLDGTLLDNQKTYLTAVAGPHWGKARAAGVKVVVVTGRHHVAIHPFYQALQIDTQPFVVTAPICTTSSRKRYWLPIRWQKSRPSRYCNCSSKTIFTA
ncbi:pyridoxal phosphate (PLP) phosphatase [Serratia fonticola]|uniref:Pyridoxal phosphate (PLP) phosphatase n=1 Tax=Serratia fonticola TaxID=47917 RepID=A0A4V6KTT1_SERFO|nr:pyridoxal phosphate (PLP) phosphatase [Serratia fonticola]